MNERMVCEFCGKELHIGTDDELEHSRPDGKRFTGNTLFDRDGNPNCLKNPAGLHEVAIKKRAIPGTA